MEPVGESARILPFPPQPRGRRGLPATPADGPAWVEVHRGTEAEALVVRALLESAGIPTAVRARLAPSVHPFTVGDQGTVQILVPAADAARTRGLLGGRAARRSPR